MKKELVDLLCCPAEGSPLRLVAAEEENGTVKEGWLVNESGRQKYPITSFIPRFAGAGNYAVNFGLQWNRFRSTQLDSVSGCSISRDRFLGFSGWSPAELKNRWVLDVGCGAGRFTEIALGCGARVVSIDYSSAVEACHANLGCNPRLDILQADIYQLPFRPGLFDFVYCFGVLQHTPDVKGALLQLPKQLRPGGKLALDLYPKVWQNWLWPKYWLRPLTKRIPPLALLRILDANLNYLLLLSSGLARVPGIGHRLKHIIPVANYKGVYPLTPQQLREWALLDTWDMLSPQYDQPQTKSALKAWLDETGLQEVDVIRRGFLVARGTKPSFVPVE